MNIKSNQPPQQPVPGASRTKSSLTAICIVLAGGVIGVVTTVVTRALQEIQQQLGSGAAPGLLALVVKLLYTSLSLLAGAADAVVEGATVGLGAGLVAALVYLTYRWWRGRNQSTSGSTLLLILVVTMDVGVSEKWLGLD